MPGHGSPWKLLPRALLLACVAGGAEAQIVSVLADVNPTGSSEPRLLFDAGADLCFIAEGSVGDDELWCSDGTSAGTRNVTDTLPGGDFASIQDVGAAGGTRFVGGSRIGTGAELYAVTAGDVPSLLDLNPTGSSTPKNFATFGDVLLFSASDGVHGAELWRSDGTPAGTFMILDINPTGSSNPAEFAVIGSEVYFAADDGVTGTEFWKTDGTAAGTQLVKNIATGLAGGVPRGSFPRDFVEFEGDALFWTNFTDRNRLFRTDGTEAGTLNLSGGMFTSTSGGLAKIGDFVYFGAAMSGAGSEGTEPWRGDGEVGGFEALGDVLPGPLASQPRSFTGLGNLILFPADSFNGSGPELWRTQGSVETTEQVLDMNPTGADNVGTPQVLGNKIYFAGTDGVSGLELWQSDGTEPGTSQVVDLLPSGGSNPLDLTVYKGCLYFTASAPVFGREVFVLRCPVAVPLSPWTLPITTLGLLGLAAWVRSSRARKLGLLSRSR